MRLRAIGGVFGACAASLLAACSVEPQKAGQTCARSTECVAGLVCSEGRCTDDLTALGELGTVPMLMMQEQASMEPPVGDASDAPDASESRSPDAGE